MGTDGLNHDAIFLEVPHQIVDPLNVNDELSKIGQDNAFFEIRNNLRMTDGVSSMPVEVERPIKKLGEILCKNLIRRFAFTAIVGGLEFIVFLRNHPLVYPREEAVAVPVIADGVSIGLYQQKNRLFAGGTKHESGAGRAICLVASQCFLEEPQDNVIAVWNSLSESPTRKELSGFSWLWFCPVARLNGATHALD